MDNAKWDTRKEENHGMKSSIPKIKSEDNVVNLDKIRKSRAKKDS